MNLSQGEKIRYGVLAGLLCVTPMVYSAHKRRQASIAAEFMIELKKEIRPAIEGILSSDAFDIHYRDKVKKKLKGKRFIVLTDKSAENLAAKIKASWGWINDDEAKVRGVFRSLKDHVQVSQVAKAYWANGKNNNLIDDLTWYMPEEVGGILKQIDKLPKYRKVST